MKFYACPHCGNVITKLTNKGVPVVCCGEKMEELVANEVDASVEKHVPIIQGNKVLVGEVNHPMTEDHYIEWIVIVTEGETHIKHLNPNDQPEFEFSPNSAIKEVYAYCNLHSLWKSS